MQVTVPSVTGSSALWALTLRAPGGAPQVGEEVLVGFDAGLSTQPYVVGVLASGQPPTTVELSDGNGNSVRLSSSGIDVTAAAEVRISASRITFTSGTGTVDAGIWTFSGVVRSQTLITESVVAASYTPGAGNVT